VTVTARSTVGGTAVRLEVDDLAATVLDRLADAYGQDPTAIGSMLMALASARQHLADVQLADRIPDRVRHNVARIARSFREELAEETGPVGIELTPDDATGLAAALTASVLPPLPAAA